jgi:hypothetical protein
MLTLNPRQETGYPPREQGQVIEINPNCMKVNFGFRFVRGILTGLILAFVSLSFFLDILIYLYSGKFFATQIILGDVYKFIYYIAPIMALEMYLWPSAPPMIFDRVNRRIIFQVFFRTKIIAWDDCVASIQHFVQASTAHASQGYNLRIEGNVINGKPGSKPQRAAAMIHQSGLSEDLFNYWEYIRHYMDGGPEAVPQPMKLYNRSAFSTPFQVYWAMLPKPGEIWEGLKHPKTIWNFFAELFFACFLVFALFVTPLVIPLFLMHMLAIRLGRVRRYPKEIMKLCKEGQALAKEQTQKSTKRNPVIRVNGKLIDSD